MKIIPSVTIQGAEVEQDKEGKVTSRKRIIHPVLTPVEMGDEEAQRLIDRGFATQATKEALKEASDLEEEFPHRSALIAGKLLTREAVGDASDEELTGIRGIGKKGVEEIRAALAG